MQSEENIEEQVLFDRLGGEAVVCAAVDDWYLRIAADKALSPFFDAASIEKIKNHQLRFLRIAFTGTPELFDVDAFILSKHERVFDMGLNTDHFDLVVEHFVATLRNLQLRENLIHEAVGIISPLRSVFEKGTVMARLRMSSVEQTKLSDRLLEHMNDDEIADVILLGNDGIRVPACRFLLAVRSQVFRRMLFGHFKEAESEVVPIGYDSKVLRAIIEFCYVDEIKSLRDCEWSEDTARTVVHLVKAAHYFEIPDLSRIGHDLACSIMRKKPPLACAVLDEGENSGEAVHTDLLAEAQDLILLKPKAALLPSVQTKHQFLLHRLGGEPALTAAVEELYIRVLDDTSLLSFFEGSNLKVLKEHQIVFMRMVFTEVGKDIDVEKMMFAKHYGLFEDGLNEEHFDTLMRHFVQSLQHIHVEKAVIDEALSRIMPLRDVFETGAAKFKGAN